MGGRRTKKLNRLAHAEMGWVGGGGGGGGKNKEIEPVSARGK